MRKKTVLEKAVKGDTAKKIWKWNLQPKRLILLQIVVTLTVLCCYVAIANNELGGLVRAIPRFAK